MIEDIRRIQFSVCMSVYKNDNADDFKRALNSIYEEQTIKPNEIILIVDGPISDTLNRTIVELQGTLPILKVKFLECNMGHAVARQTGLDLAVNNLVAVMDSDDISVPTRFEKQLRFFVENDDVSVVGGLINEFIESPDNVVGIRACPENDQDIKDYMKVRCPMNQMTVMYKKEDIEQVGGYQDWYCEEDYFLWARLALAGYKFYNIQENLVNVRVGNGMYSRRGGIKYFQSEARLQKYLLDNGIINLSTYCLNVIKRLIVQVLLPNSIRGWVFRKFARVKFKSNS